MRNVFLRVILILSVGISGCGQNPIAAFANNNSDAALYQSGLDAINSSNWLTAIKDFQSMSANGQQDRDVMFNFATALAGQCGFNMASFFSDIEPSLSGGAINSSLPLVLMQAFQNTTINMVVAGATAPTLVTDSTTSTYCSWSQQVMDNIQTKYGAWNSNEQTFVVIYSLAKIGMILKYLAGSTGNLNGSSLLIPDATFDSCKSASLPDFYVAQIVTAYALIAQNSSAVSAFSALSVLTTGLCSNIALPGPAAAPMALCSHTTPALVQASSATIGVINPGSKNDLVNMRGMLMSQVSGAPGGAGNTFFPFSILDSSTVYAHSASSDGSWGSPWQCTLQTYTANPGGSLTDGYLSCCY